MLARMLNTHPRVGCLNEVFLDGFLSAVRPLFADQQRRRSVSAEIASAKNDFDVGGFGPSIQSSEANDGRAAQANQYRSERESALGGHGFGTGPGTLDAELHAAKVVRALFEIALGKPGLYVLGSKIPNLDLLQAKASVEADLGDLRFLHIIRRPGDVVNSSLARRNNARQASDRWHIETVEDACLEWLYDTKRLALARRELGSRLLVIKYEDLVGHDEQTVLAIAEHLNVSPEFDVDVCRPLPESLRGYALTDEEKEYVTRFFADIESRWGKSVDDIMSALWNVFFPLPQSGIIDFRSNGNGKLYVLNGFSSPEPWGRWTDEPHACLAVEIDGGIEDISIHLVCQAWPSEDSAHARITFRVEDWQQTVHCDVRQTGEFFGLRLIVPRAALSDPARLVLNIYPASPKKPTQPPYAEVRRLGLGLVKMEINLVCQPSSALYASLDEMT